MIHPPLLHTITFRRLQMKRCRLQTTCSDRWSGDLCIAPVHTLTHLLSPLDVYKRLATFDSGGPTTVTLHPHIGSSLLKRPTVSLPRFSTILPTPRSSDPCLARVLRGTHPFRGQSLDADGLLETTRMRVALRCRSQTGVSPTRKGTAAVQSCERLLMTTHGLEVHMSLCVIGVCQCWMRRQQSGCAFPVSLGRHIQSSTLQCTRVAIRRPNLMSQES
jgi:hypothetical protein